MLWMSEEMTVSTARCSPPEGLEKQGGLTLMTWWGPCGVEQGGEGAGTEWAMGTGKRVSEPAVQEPVN